MSKIITASGPQGLHPECALVCGLAACRGEADAREERLTRALAEARAAIREAYQILARNDPRISLAVWLDLPAVKSAKMGRA